MIRSPGLGKRFGRAFLIQAILISLAAILGVYAAAFAIEELLIKQALREEAEYFWSNFEADREFPLPDTLNLTGYMAREGRIDAVPKSIRGLGSGFHHLPTQADLSLVFVTENHGQRLFLVFDGEKVGELALYFGLLPLASVLIVIYLLSWIGYRLSWRALSPILFLSHEVHKLDLESPDAAVFSPNRLPGSPDREVIALADALTRLVRRINDFAERERNFTRDASHEFRSPLTVIKIAADMLLSEQELEVPARNSVLRIRRAASDMEELVEVFLLLARESDQGISKDSVCVNEVVSEEIELATIRLEEKPVSVEITANCRLFVHSSDKVLSVLLGNLIRNAFDYTDDGFVKIHIEQDSVTISDSGTGMGDQDLENVFKPFHRGGERRRGGHGVGLTIVKRLSERFGWPVHIRSELNVGTQIRVEFPDARIETLETDTPQQ